MDKFRETERVADAHKGHNGWHHSVTIPENIQNLRERLEESPRKSTRRLSLETDISRTSVLMILHDIKACVRYFVSIFLFFHQMIALQELWKMFFISSKKLFPFSRYWNFCNFSPSFPHFPDSKEQMEVE